MDVVRMLVERFRVDVNEMSYDQTHHRLHSSGFVTSAVGVTALPDGSLAGDAETTTSDFASGGGFSNVWSQPSYQNAAVSP